MNATETTAATITIDPNDPFAGLVAPEDRGGLARETLEKGARVLAVELLSAASAAGCGTWDDAVKAALARALEKHAASTTDVIALAKRLASPYRRGVALYGTDGTRNVVWGVGETEADAAADAALQDDLPTDLYSALITPAALTKVAVGAVALDEGTLDLRREAGIGWVIDIHVDLGDAATAALELNEQLTKRGFETLTAAELRGMAESTEAIDVLIDDLHQTSTIPTGETGGVLASYRAELRAMLREWLEDQAGERGESDVADDEDGETEPLTWVATIYDGGGDGQAWPTHTRKAFDIPGDETNRADVRKALIDWLEESVAEMSLGGEDYEVGDELTARAWPSDDSGFVQVTYEITAEDLGEADEAEA